MSDEIICQCHVVTNRTARAHANDITFEGSSKKCAGRIFQAACNGKGCGGCNANFEKLVETMKAEGWAPRPAPL